MFKFLSSDPVHNPTASSTADTEVKTTTCYMCACRCGIRVHLRDGQVRYIDGNPDHPLNKGVICAKGSSGIMKQVSPARLTQPLLRKPGSERGGAAEVPGNLRRLTNIGTFRAYVQAYLKANPDIHPRMTCMVRQLASGPQGIPLELYCFTATTVWADYERIQADIFDRLFALLPEFGLRPYQQPSGYDVQEGLARLGAGQAESPPLPPPGS